MIQKTAASKADAVCIDLEDAVAPERKGNQPRQRGSRIPELDFGGKLRMFRMNGLDTHFAYRIWSRWWKRPAISIDLIVVPKVNRPKTFMLWKPC
jgi:citrate lyase beta subunit